MKQTYEEKLFKVLAVIIGLYTLLSSAHLLVTYWLGSNAWLIATLPDGIAIAIMVIGTLIGVATLSAAWFNKRKLLYYALGTTWFFQFAIALINVLEYVGKGTPAIPALAIGAVAVVLFAYYKNEEEELSHE